MALNLSQKLKFAAAVGFSALPLTGCSDTEGSSDQSASNTHATAPAAVETAPAAETVNQRPDIETLRKNMIKDSYENIVFYYGAGMDRRGLAAAQTILEENGYPSVFYRHDPEQDKAVEIPPEGFRVIIGGATSRILTQRQLFEGRVFRYVEHAWDRYKAEYKADLIAALLADNPEDGELNLLAADLAIGASGIGDLVSLLDPEGGVENLDELLDGLDLDMLANVDDHITAAESAGTPVSDSQYVNAGAAIIAEAAQKAGGFDNIDWENDPDVQQGIEFAEKGGVDLESYFGGGSES